MEELYALFVDYKTVEHSGCSIELKACLIVAGSNSSSREGRNNSE